MIGEGKHGLADVETQTLVDDIIEVRNDDQERDGSYDTDYSGRIWTWGEERLCADMIKTLNEIASGRWTCGDDLIDMARTCLDPNRKIWPCQPGSR